MSDSTSTPTPTPVATPAPDATASPAVPNDTAPADGLTLSEETSALTAGIGAEETEAPAEGEAPTEDAAAKPEDDKPAEDETKPLEYKDFKLPEGLNKDDPMLATFTEAAAKHRVPQGAAEAMLSELAPRVTEALSAPYKEWEKRQTAWLDAIKNDAEIGGDKLKPAQIRMGRLMADKDLVDPEFAQAMIETGAGNHPAVVRTFARIAARLTEGSPTPRGNPPGQARSLAERMYPNLPVR